MSSAEYNIADLVQGQYWSLELTLKDSSGAPIDVTSRHLFGQFRAGKEATATLVHVLDSNTGTIVKTDPANGVFTLVITATEALEFGKRATTKGEWELWIDPGLETRKRLIRGPWKADSSIVTFEAIP